MADEKYQYRVTLHAALNPMTIQQIMRDTGLLNDFRWEDVGVYYSNTNAKMQVKLVPRDEKTYFKWELKGGVDAIMKQIAEYDYVRAQA